MPGVEHDDFCGRFEAQTVLLRDAAVAAGPETPVPNCPDWTVQRLVAHVGRVFGIVDRVVRLGDPAAPPAKVGALTGNFDEVLVGYDERRAALIALLRGTDPAAPAWHFSPTAPKTVAFWSRRMAHESTVHRLDAEGAAGRDAPVEPEFAADGTDEVLTRLIHRPTDRWAVAGHSGTVLYHAADAGRAWTVRLVPGQLPQAAPEIAPEPDASVVGLADAVYRAVWGRPSGAAVSGDETLVRATRAS